MAEVIRMPLMSDTMEEGKILQWHKKVGDEVETGDILAEVETDKATMELESYFDGKLLYIGVNEGDTVPVDAVMAVVGEEGEDYQKVLEEAKAEEKGKEEKEVKEAEQTNETQKEKKQQVEDLSEVVLRQEKNPEQKEEKRIKASPLARRLASEKRVDLNQVHGTGDGGRIVKRDIEKLDQEAPLATHDFTPAIAEQGYIDQPVSQMRKTIAKRLAQSKFNAPHFYLTIEITMDRASQVRKRLNENEDLKISYNDLIIKAAAMSLRQHPQVNASWMEDNIRFYKHVHIGMAVAVDEGLIVPVIRHADHKGVAQISGEAKELAKKARNKDLQPNDWEGNTFSVSNLGMFGIDEFTGIINPPDSCLLAIGTVKKVPVVKEGKLEEQEKMKVTMSCDHRVVDGAIGSRFLSTFRELLEEPVRMIL